jgi:hypothetical protein
VLMQIVTTVAWYSLLWRAVKFIFVFFIITAVYFSESPSRLGDVIILIHTSVLQGRNASMFTGWDGTLPCSQAPLSPTLGASSGSGWTRRTENSCRCVYWTVNPLTADLFSSSCFGIEQRRTNPDRKISTLQVDPKRFWWRVLLRILLTWSVALVRKRTIPTERPPLVGEVTANFCG